MRLLAATTLLVAACSSVATNYDYDTSYDFTKLKTYAWARAVGQPEASPLVLERIRAAVDAELGKRGYTRVGKEADFLVATFAGRQSRIQVTDWGYRYGPPGYWYHGGIDVYQYEEGTLILDVVDGKSKRLVWRGTATSTIDPSATPEKRTEKINAAVAKVLERFPPTP